MKFYTVRDETASFFLPPYLARNDGQAIRMFIGSLGDSFPYRRDFSLYEVGSFDEDNGLITATEPRIVINGLSIALDLDPRVNPISPEELAQ